MLGRASASVPSPHLQQVGDARRWGRSVCQGAVVVAIALNPPPRWWRRRIRTTGLSPAPPAPPATARWHGHRPLPPQERQRCMTAALPSAAIFRPLYRRRRRRRHRRLRHRLPFPPEPARTAPAAPCPKGRPAGGGSSTYCLALAIACPKALALGSAPRPLLAPPPPTVCGERSAAGPDLCSSGSQVTPPCESSSHFRALPPPPRRSKAGTLVPRSFGCE